MKTHHLIDRLVRVSLSIFVHFVKENTSRCEGEKRSIEYLVIALREASRLLPSNYRRRLMGQHDWLVTHLILVSNKPDN